VILPDVVSIKELAALRSATHEMIVNGLEAVASRDNLKAGPKVVVFRDSASSRFATLALRWVMMVRMPIQLIIKAPTTLITRCVEWAERRTAAPNAPKTQ